MVQTQSMAEDMSKKTSNSMLELEDSIDFDLKEINKGKAAIKERSQQFNDRLLADTEYGRINDEVKEKQKLLKEAKKEAFKRDEQLGKLSNEISVLRVDVKMRKLTLSDNLVEYKEKTNRNSVSIQGQLFEFETYAQIKFQ